MHGKLYYNPYQRFFLIILKKEKNMVKIHIVLRDEILRNTQSKALKLYVIK